MKGSIPCVNLLWERRVFGDFKPVAVDIDVTLEGTRALAIGYTDRHLPVVVFMTGVSDRVARIALHQKINLVEFRLVILMRIGCHTVIDGERYITIFKEGDHIVHILQRGSSE